MRYLETFAMVTLTCLFYATAFVVIWGLVFGMIWTFAEFGPLVGAPVACVGLGLAAACLQFVAEHGP